MRLMRLMTLSVLFVVACGRGEPPAPATAPPSASPPVVVVPAPAPAAPSGDAAARPQQPPSGIAAWIRAHYTKYEYRIPMRDGARLFTSVLVPNDASPTKKYPILLRRTPYSAGPYGADRYPGMGGSMEPFAREGFIFVSQDVRGTNMSEGTFEDVRPIRPAGVAGGGANGASTDESTDTYDTIAWLLKALPHHNGKVGQWGVSYDGFYTSAGIIDGHPALVAASPQAPVGDWWIGDDMHRNGAFVLHEAFDFFGSFDRPRPAPTSEREVFSPIEFGTPDAYQYFLDLGVLAELGPAQFGAEVPFWKDLVAHPDYDEFWKARNILPRLRGVRAAVLVVGGWYDTEDLYGTLETYRAIEAQNPGARNSLVMGPWRHGGWYGAGDRLGDTEFGFPTGPGFVDLLLAFFKHHLKGGPAPGLPEALVFETGANRWRSFPAWPPREVRDAALYLREGGGLAREAPPAGGEPAFDEFPSDPARPVPYTQNPETRYWSAEYMSEDQRFAARRPDVLVYQTPPLEQDVTIAGPIGAELYVSTTGTDADWVVKLIDVSPGKLPGWTRRDLEDGKPDKGARQLLVRGEPFRGRYRDGLDAPRPFVPGEVAKVAFQIDDVFHTFQRGHRIMVQIQSSWFPFIDRNPQTFVPNIYRARRADFVKATHRVHRGGAAASRLLVKLLPAADEAASAAPR
jgi:putative CocE/NonD family hydrolase